MPVGTEEELQRAIAQMLKGEFPVEEQTQNTYAKVIVFGMENQEEGNLPDELKEAQVTEVLCAREPDHLLRRNLQRRSDKNGIIKNRLQRRDYKKQFVKNSV